MDLFFSREAEKSPIVREHRDLLIDLHRYLAWVIQTEAEQANGKGSVTEDRLKEILGKYLETEGHAISLVTILFTGMIERVVALVSRVQGTFEFEVQPLREYFAARHLYETAPYSPPGSEKKGTKPERFDVLSRNFYWLNVTRFYCGCYSKGELSSLADGVIELSKSSDFENTSYPRLMALMLLSDWVFTQQPLIVSRLVSMIISEPGFRILLSNMQRSDSGANLIAPERCGKSELINACRGILAGSPKRDEIDVLAAALKESLSSTEVGEFWHSVKPIDKALDLWIFLGSKLGVYKNSSLGNLAELFNEVGSKLTRYYGHNERFDIIESRADIFSSAVQLALEGEGELFVPKSSPFGVIPYISRIGSALDFSNYTAVLGQRTAHSMRELILFRHALPLRNGMAIQGVSLKVAEAITVESVIEPAFLDHCEKLLASFLEVSEMSCAVWTTNLEPWSKFVEAGTREFGNAPVFFGIALIAAGISSKSETGRIGVNFVDAAVPLCDRVRFARLKSGAIRWWSDQLEVASEKEDIIVVAFTLFVWATPRTIVQLASQLSSIVDDFDLRTFNQLIKIIGRMGQEKIALDQAAIATLKKCSPRLSAILVARSSRANSGEVAEVLLRDYHGNDPVILRLCVECMMPRARQDKLVLKAALPLIKRAYALGVVAASPRLSRELARETGALFAREILAEVRDYPLVLVDMAQRYLTKNAGRKAKAPGTVANKEQWFSGVAATP